MDRAKLEAFLLRERVFGIVHRVGTPARWPLCCLPPGPPVLLGVHLLGVYDMLVAAGAEPDVCLAGGLHSVYGTNRFKGCKPSDARRAAVRAAFGDAVERLVFLFSTVNRPRGLDNGVPTDSASGQPAAVSPAELRALRLVEAANLLDQDHGAELRRDFPQVAAVWDEQLRGREREAAAA